jgi:hypothetical protein
MPREVMVIGLREPVPRGHDPEMPIICLCPLYSQMSQILG